MSKVVAVLAIIVAGGVARAQPSSGAKLGFYGEVSVGGGRVGGTFVSAINGFRSSYDESFLHARASIGISLIDRLSLGARLGLALDAFKHGSSSGAFGIEGEVDRHVSSCWRGGLRISASSANGGYINGQLGMIGVRARNPYVVLGLDAFAARDPESKVHGVTVTAGLTGSPGKKAVIVTAAGAAVVGIIFGVLLLQNPTH